MRNLDLIDHMCCHFDNFIRTISDSHPTQRLLAKESQEQVTLTHSEKKHAAGLMRINHTGEVCAQALYQGQSITCQNTEISQTLQQSQQEEIDHLVWCAKRIQALNERTSFLNPFWYAASLLIGMAVGLLGDRINMGFLAETERQVVQHLKSHLHKLPDNDTKSRAIVEQMIIEEGEHIETAERLGANELSQTAKSLMAMSASIMIGSTYYI